MFSHINLNTNVSKLTFDLIIIALHVFPDLLVNRLENFRHPRRLFFLWLVKSLFTFKNQGHIFIINSAKRSIYREQLSMNIWLM